MLANRIVGGGSQQRNASDPDVLPPLLPVRRTMRRSKAKRQTGLSTSTLSLTNGNVLTI
jgi:hypothetical protein